MFAFKLIEISVYDVQFLIFQSAEYVFRKIVNSKAIISEFIGYITDFINSEGIYNSYILMNHLYKTFNPKEQDLKTNYQLLISGIIPRPIALVSSLSSDGVGNLAPFSFYNGFSAQPPIVGFSPALDGRDAQPKDTLVNIKDTKEFTISMVSVDMAEQMLITSNSFTNNIDEFDKSGFIRRESIKVSPPHVYESPFIMECKLYDIIELGSLQEVEI